MLPKFVYTAIGDIPVAAARLRADNDCGPPIAISRAAAFSSVTRLLGSCRRRLTLDRMA